MHTPKTCDDCTLTWDRKNNVKDIVLCPLHRAAPKLLEALEALRHEYLRMLVDYGSHVRGEPAVQALTDAAIRKAKS